MKSAHIITWPDGRIAVYIEDKRLESRGKLSLWTWLKLWWELR